MSGGLREEIGQKKPFDSLEQEVLLNIIRTHDALRRDFDVLFKRVGGLSATQFNVLRILRGAGPNGMACREIGSRMITRDPDMTRLLDRLEKSRLIVRSRDSNDRRVVKTRITKHGLALLARLDGPVHKLHRDQLSHMESGQLKRLCRLLQEARKKP